MTTSPLVDLPQVCSRPVFIIGAPRSGTSALAWSLYQHPNFWTSQETEFLAPLFGGARLHEAYEVGTARPRTWLREQKVDRGEFFAYVGLGINALFTSRSGGKRWVDQTPGYTLLADTLADLFPGACFLHILRDGRSVVRSMTHFREAVGRGLSETGGLPSWARSFEGAVETWRSFVEAALAFCARQPQRSLTIVHEHLVADPPPGFQRILDFLGAPQDSGPANFFRSCRINSSFRPFQWGSRDAGDAASRPELLGAARAAWEEWTADQRAFFAAKAGDVLVAQGFATEAELA
jgi:hypothetical protein